MTPRRDDQNETRKRNLTVAAQALGLPPDLSNASTTAALALAWLGWVWRAEEGVDLAATMDALARAGVAATANKVAVERLPGAIAWEFLEAGGNPRRASADSEALNRAFDEAYPHYQAALGRNEALYAFTFGAAVHDAEQIVV